MSTTNEVRDSNNFVSNENKRRLTLIIITLVFIIAAIAYGIYYELVLSKEIDTDNAYVGGNLVSLSSQVTGNVQAIGVDETQLVKAGAEIIKLDPTDADLALKQAEARLGNAVRQLRERYASVAQYDAAIEVQKIALKNAKDDLSRRAPLGADHTVSGEELAHAKEAVEKSGAALDVAIKQADASRAGIAGIAIESHPAILAAKADFVQAWLAARRNAVLAPVAGYVAKRSVQVGAHVTPGTALLSIVPLDQLWIDANFKESELQNIRVGQTVKIQVDMYGDKITFHGKVVGLSAGTGSAFSLLPAQNATGNWIKVVQRLPVRISLDSKELLAHPLRIGLSATATVNVSDASGTTLGALMPASPVYATQALNQPTQVAENTANAIVSKNLQK